jgi:hypothetical protein
MEKFTITLTCLNCQNDFIMTDKVWYTYSGEWAGEGNGCCDRVTVWITCPNCDNDEELK